MDSRSPSLDPSRVGGHGARQAAIAALPSRPSRPFTLVPPRVAGRVLVVEGSRAVADGLKRALSDAGFAVAVARDAAEARTLLEARRPDVVVLDVVLPGRHHEGWALLRELCARDDAVPVLVLSAATAEHEKVRGLRLGADDYMAKPIGSRELVARVEAVMRRSGAAPRAARRAAGDADAAASPGSAEVLHVADVAIDVGARSVRRGDLLVALTGTEFELLLHLARRRGHVVGQAELLRVAFARDHHARSRTVVMHVSSLRRKLGDDPAAPRIIHTVWGFGYRVAG